MNKAFKEAVAALSEQDLKVAPQYIVAFKAEQRATNKAAKAALLEQVRALTPTRAPRGSKAEEAPKKSKKNKKRNRSAE